MILLLRFLFFLKPKDSVTEETSSPRSRTIPLEPSSPAVKKKEPLSQFEDFVKEGWQDVPLIGMCE